MYNNYIDNKYDGLSREEKIELLLFLSNKAKQLALLNIDSQKARTDEEKDVIEDEIAEHQTILVQTMVEYEIVKPPEYTMVQMCKWLYANFNTVDVDKNGYLILAEINAIFEDMTQEKFDVLNTNNDGKLTLQEITDFLAIYKY